MNVQSVLAVHVHPHVGSGGFRNLERGVQSLASEVHPKIFGLPCPLPVIATDWYLASELFKIAGSPN